jgi:hypothetical protein
MILFDEQESVALIHFQSIGAGWCYLRIVVFHSPVALVTTNVVLCGGPAQSLQTCGAGSPSAPTQGLGVISCNRIIAPAAKLKDAEPVAKRIAQRSLPAPGEGLKFPFEFCSSRNGTFNSSGDILDFKVQMHWRPVSAVVAK